MVTCVMIAQCIRELRLTTHIVHLTNVVVIMKSLNGMECVLGVKVHRFQMVKKDRVLNKEVMLLL